jgi:hypothetical protein
MSSTRTILGVWVALLAFPVCAPLLAQDRMAQAAERYERETEPVKKARALVKLGEAHIELARKHAGTGEFVASLDTLTRYRDQVRQTFDALKATGIDAERKPAGFKELQIGLRRGIRDIDHLILTLPTDRRPFFREIRGDLAAVQNALIDALFPRRPGRPSTP